MIHLVLCGVVAIVPRLGLASGEARSAESTGQEPLARFSSRVQLVEVYASVTDATGEPIQGLKREDFVVAEDGEAQAVTTFAEGQFPLAVAIGVDRSWSMAGEKLANAKAATRSFLNLLKPEDRSMVVAIGAEAEVIAPLSTDRVAQVRAVERLDPWSTTSLHDAIIAALDRLAPEAGRQALIVFSDGVDRYSEHTSADVLARARRSNALVYPIAFGKTRPPLLAELAVLTGGRSFLLKDTRELEATLATIARELRHQYLLGYAPARPFSAGQGEWRSIRVTLRNAPIGARVRARDGYRTES
jgi:Ca-activated chloride channel family protein